MVVAVNGVRTPASGLIRRLLRRTVLVAAFTGAGWLLGVLLAGGASASPLPEPDYQPPTTQVTEHLARLDDLLTDLTQSVTSTVDTIVAEPPSLPMPPKFEPAAIPPEQPRPLPVPDTVTDVLTADEPPTVTRQPRTPSAPRAPPVTVARVPEPVPDRAAAMPTRRPSSATAGGHDHHSPRPDKAPAPLPGGGPTATAVHDSYAGARGTQGIVIAPVVFEAPPAGFSTRGRAAGVSGRVAGLPATSPD